MCKKPCVFPQLSDHSPLVHERKVERKVSCIHYLLSDSDYLSGMKKPHSKRTSCKVSTLGQAYPEWK